MTAPTLASPATEVRRLREQLADAERELAQLRALFAAPDPMATPEHWRAIFRDAHEADLGNAYRQGRAEVEAEYAAAWSSLTGSVLAIADPRGPEAHASVARRLMAAESGQRRDAADQERAFVGRAQNTADQNRTDAQRGAVRLYPLKGGPPR